MEENKKNKWVLGGLIGVLVALVIGMGIFIFYDKVLSKSNNDIEYESGNQNQLESDIDSSKNEHEENISDELNESNNENQLESDSDNIENDSAVNNIDKSNFDGISSDVLEGIISKIEVYNKKFSNNYPISDFKSFSNNMSNQEKLRFLLYNINNFSFGENFTKNDLDNVVLQYFNDDFEFTHESIFCFTGEYETSYNYNQETGLYIYNENHGGHGGEGYYRDTPYLINGFYDENSKEYIINAKILYGDFCDECGPLVGIYDSNSRDKIIYGDDCSGGCDFDDAIDIDMAYEIVKDKLPITVFKFIENSSQEIVLKSVTIEK